MSAGGEDPVVIVSTDTHIGPRLVEDLRPYCPSAYLDDFDGYVAEVLRQKEAMKKVQEDAYFDHPNIRIAGHYDHDARVADYDRDGVAAGVIFHGSQNGEPIPFEPSRAGRLATASLADRSAGELELVGVGREMYNRWLADFVANAPERHAGMAQLPMWDVDKAVAELTRSSDAGLRGVNFPVIQAGIPGYNLPEWEPFWSLCEERGLPLVTHVGAGGTVDGSTPGGLLIEIVEVTGWLSRRAIWWLMLSGVFERHPGLKLVLTETPGNWWPATVQELESVWDLRVSDPSSPYRSLVPRRPAEYMANNVYVAATGTSAYEAQQAVEHGIVPNVMWGSDYPHVEGTFVSTADDTMPSVTKLS